MIYVYNFLQTVLLIVFLPVLLLLVACKEKYRSRIGGRLGRGLEDKVAALNTNRTTIWIHALSVGEVTSALPLVQGLRQEMDPCIVFSAATRTGMKLAEEKIAAHVDVVIPAPLDLLPVVRKFIRLIRPDMFILVETDFWPNWLLTLQRRAIPTVLVNGRISRKSFASYRRFRLFFLPMFRSFTLMSMQTQQDAVQMQTLGIPSERIKTLGNLKYDTNLYDATPSSAKPPGWDQRIPDNARIWICGSTHPGEEGIIIAAYAALSGSRPDLFLILAPRDPGRAGEISELLHKYGLAAMRRTRPQEPEASVLILDTIGELAGYYQFSDLAFIGGSLINFGGHNPLEAATFGVPILFGPHMDDFREIARDLIESGGARPVVSAGTMEQSAGQILDNGVLRQQMGKAALTLVQQNAGVIRRHLTELRALLR